MKRSSAKITSVLLAVIMVITAVAPSLTALAASPVITVTDANGAQITEKIEVQEYRSVQLSYTVTGDKPDGAYVKWVSNLPLLADVDDTGKVTGYDYSKAAIIQLWLDENVDQALFGLNKLFTDAELKHFNDLSLDLSTSLSRSMTSSS